MATPEARQSSLASNLNPLSRNERSYRHHHACTAGNQAHARPGGQILGEGR